MKFGVISDTHGLIRTEALEALKDCQLILHAGDVGSREVLEALKEIAPVRAIRGNVDTALWTEELPISDLVEVEGFSFYLVHDYSFLDLNPQAAGFDAVVYGHSHKASINYHNEVLLLNPGSAGPRRFSYPVTVALIEIAQGKLEPQIVSLDVKEAP
jgi:uncharacterized protein